MRTLSPLHKTLPGVTLAVLEPEIETLETPGFQARAPSSTDRSRPRLAGKTTLSQERVIGIRTIRS